MLERIGSLIVDNVVVLLSGMMRTESRKKSVSSCVATNTSQYFRKLWWGCIRDRCHTDKMTSILYLKLQNLQVK